MKALLVVLCIALTACANKDSGRPLNGSLNGALQQGMTEQQVAEVSGRVPDRVVMKTCGTETPKPFACKVYVYDGTLHGIQYDRTLWVVMEDVKGEWVVIQWL
jgi:hypothetical protein